MGRSPIVQRDIQETTPMYCMSAAVGVHGARPSIYGSCSAPGAPRLVRVTQVLQFSGCGIDQ